MQQEPSEILRKLFSAGKAYLLPLYRPIQLSLAEEQEVQFPRPGLEQIARPKPGFGERYVFPGFRLRIMAMTKVRILHGSIRGIELHLVGRVRPPCVVGSCNRGLEGETYLKDSHYSYRNSLREAFS